MDNKKLQQCKVEFAKFKKSLKDMDLEALKKLEQDIIKECEEVEKKVRTSVYKLPKKNQAEIAAKICMLLNKQEVQWQYTLGFVNLYELWTKEIKEISYDDLDSTLRTLGNMQFKGYDEWKAVVEINNYFEAVRDAYANDTQDIFFMAEKHNAVMDEMGLKDPNRANPGPPQVK